MNEGDALAQRFEEQRPHLRAVAHRMLGSRSEADDAVQEAWLHMSRAGTEGVDNLRGWLTTVVARVCLDMLRARRSRREEQLEGDALGPGTGGSAADPEAEALVADAVGTALLVVLDRLSPSERVAFVLHDVFGVAFDDVARVVGRSEAAARQLASRARRRVRGAGAEPEATADLARRHAVVDAFLAAARGGNFEALLAVLDPDVALRPDTTAASLGAAEMRGAANLARFIGGRARGAQRAIADGAPAAVWAPGGRPRVVWLFTIVGERVTAIDFVADADSLARIDLAILRD